ncbi:alpha/beta fold hydrolase [Subtercola lobariae]|uniref:Arylesterase n=1 Tax=Subtercola lobariae TaxID=1588641 RepID=A0A917BG60_9MICO|nr:alpha/beta hydrolase [Subtercola lobariae]GGF41391.1 arylesterase [Subtercola lobariae]
MTEITAHHGLFKDTNLHVDDTGGAGRPVVLIHGWPLSGEAFEDQVPALQAAGYRVITYDRRGFGRSDKPLTGYDYNHLTDDLHAVLEALDVSDVTLVGFSMGGGEVARYFSKYGSERLHSVVFASAITPYLLQSPGNPDGPLTAAQAAKMTASLTADADAFYDQFATDFFSVDGRVVVSEEQRQAAVTLAKQARKAAALECLTAFGTTDFRDDLAQITVPTLVIQGDSDFIVFYDGSGARTHSAIPQSELYVIAGGPHGVNVSHAEEWNRVVIDFLGK